MKTIHIKSEAIKCVADEFGAIDWQINKPGVCYVVTAHTKEDAHDAVDAYKPAQPTNEEGTLDL